jgi:hypothetical protein
MRLRLFAALGVAAVCVCAGPSALGPRLSFSTLRVDAQALTTQSGGGAVYNLKVVSDSSPDLTDLDSLIYSTTSRWSTPEEKVWALFYWSHILKRQTPPMVIHGLEVTDPIRNFSDYGYTMCSTISGINQSLYELLGLRHQYWDICNHTVSQVEWDGRFHMIDSSMSHLVTQDDGVTLASLQEAAADSARLVKERSLYSTSPYGFVTGTDTMRSLPDVVDPSTGAVSGGFARAFCENGLKFRDYYYNWDRGHRYVLNLRDDESYTRFYRRLGTTPEYWVGSEKVSPSDPAKRYEIDSGNKFGIRGNGQWTFTPALTADRWASAAYAWHHVVSAGGALQPAVAGQPGEVIYKVQAANAITSQRIRAEFDRVNAAANATIAVSLNHGHTWTQVAAIGPEIGAAVPLVANLRDEVSSAYETLVRVQMHVPSGSPDGIRLTALGIDTITQVNTKALPTLTIGRNEIVLARGDQSDTMTLWPELRGGFWQNDAYDARNIASQDVTVPLKYTAVVRPAVLTEDAYLTYRMDAPTDITRAVYGGRLHNFKAGSYIEFQHSFDQGATWIPSYRLTEVTAPYDDIHYETISDVPAGVRTILFKYVIHNTNSTAFRASGLYSARMEVNHRPAAAMSKPVDVTLRWKEVRADRTLVERSHRQRVSAFPFKYVVNVGGSDHPVMESMKLSLADESDATPFGYGDGVDAGGVKYVHVKQVEGTNLAVGKPYTVSRAPSGFQESMGASNTTILTDGIVGAPISGSTSYWWGQCWTSGTTVDLKVDLEKLTTFRAVRAHLFGYPFWDALKGNVQDQVEVLTSQDGVNFLSQGSLTTSLWKKDIPINHMVQDDEKATAWNFELRLPAPVTARYVRYRVTPKRNLCISELQVLDRLDRVPFDIRIATPDVSSGVPDKSPTNVSPVVELDSPADGSTLAAPASVVVAASASDADGAVAQVEFFANGTLIGSRTAAPWSVAWGGVAEGAYTLTARVTDDRGAATVSDAIRITVNAPPQDQPAPATSKEIVLHAKDATVAAGWTVTPDAGAAGLARLQNANAGAARVPAALASPSDYFEMTFAAEAGIPYRLWIRGKATSNNWANDSVYVQFDGSVDAAGAPVYRIGTTSSTRWQLEDYTNAGLSGWGWQDNGYGDAPDVLGVPIYFSASGLQKLRVQVREDGLGIDQIVLSAERFLDAAPGTTKNDTTILSASSGVTNARPTVALFAPTPGSVWTAPATITVSANAGDTDGTVARVEFFANGTAIGSRTAAPWSITWTGAGAGSYTITARATDNSGASTTSAGVGITVGTSAPTASGVKEVVLYAKDARAAGAWTVVSDSSAAGMARIQNSNAGAARVSAPLAKPIDYFDMTFTADAGVGYRLWMRGKATSNNWANDSVYVQFDGAVDVAGAPVYRIGSTSGVRWQLEDCMSCGMAGWGWQDNGYGDEPGVAGALVYFATSGPQTIRVQVREDGLGIDQIALSAVRFITAAPGATKNDTTILAKP